MINPKTFAAGRRSYKIMVGAAPRREGFHHNQSVVGAAPRRESASR